MTSMSEIAEAQRLCMIILDNPDLIDELITGFLELGVRGATVVESRGMGQIVRQDMPIFAGLAGLFPEATGSRMILSAMPESLVSPVLQLVEEIIEEGERAGSAVCFTLPVEAMRRFHN